MTTIESLRMQRGKLAAAILTTLVCVIVQAQQPSVSDQKADGSRTGAIAGRVVDENGQPLSNASVSLRPVGSITRQRNATTDDEGGFQFNDLESDVYTLSAYVPAHVSAPLPPSNSQATYCRLGDSVRIVLIKGAVITGTVTSSTDEPVVSVRVRAYMIRDANGKPPKFGVLQFRERTTDDRGIYRIYGLAPGTYVVSAGGLGNTFGSAMNAYDSDIPIYAPSSTRDTAAEVNLSAGEETTVDIHYRGESGRIVSGVASGLTGADVSSGFNVTLTAILNGKVQWSSSLYQPHGTSGFAFTGVADGDYDLRAQSLSVAGEIVASEPRRIKVKGADITGIELIAKPLGSVAGHITLESSIPPECRAKSRPLFKEMRVNPMRNDEDTSARIEFLPFPGTGVPDKEGAFVLRNVGPGQYSFNIQFFATYWYLQSISLSTGSTSGSPKMGSQSVDALRNWTKLKMGDRL